MRRPGFLRRAQPTDRTPEVPRITTASVALADDVARRTHRYLIQMSIRVVCFVGAVVVDHWSRWLMLVGAVVLPYVAVVLANAGRERGDDPGTFVGPGALPTGAPNPGLGTAPTETPGGQQ